MIVFATVAEHCFCFVFPPFVFPGLKCKYNNSLYEKYYQICDMLHNMTRLTLG